MRHLVLFGCVCVLAVAAAVGAEPPHHSSDRFAAAAPVDIPAPKELAAKESAPKQSAPKKSALAAKVERMAYFLMPEQEVRRALGFFGPVVKKYQPVAFRFQREYDAAEQKLPVLKRYEPIAEQALAEARAMKVAPKHEAEKEKYLRFAEGFVKAFRISIYAAEAFQ